MTAPSLFADGAADRDDVPPRRFPEASGTESNSEHRTPTSFYRKYRPQSFDSTDLVGQRHIVRTLRNAIALDRIAHAYLFSGPRGTGKTTTARLLAKAINCLNPDRFLRPCNQCPNCQAINAGSAPDIIEIDAASNRGIDDIRDLRDRVRYAPTALPAKVYIIDEAHQITGAAANAFLKTLEEPPAHSHFILATTDPEELLPTIVSRCQHYDFRRISLEDMIERLQYVAAAEGAAIAPDALQLIARHATGSLRDALGLLDQLALQQGSPEDAATAISADDVRVLLGLSRNDRVEALVEAIAQRNPGSALRIVQDAVDAGEDPRQLNRQLVMYIRTLLFERSAGSIEADKRAKSLAAVFTLHELATHAKRFSEIDFSIRHSPFPHLPLEVALVEAAADASAPAEANSSASSPTRTEEPTQPAGPSRTSSLRDRVRGVTGAGEPRVPEGLTVVPQTLGTITPIRPPVPDSPSTLPARGSTASNSVDQIAELWPAIRTDVKAVNRRVEALLSEVDPVAVSGNQITFAVPYPFHRDKLNSDDVRETISSVLSRHLGRTVSMVCVLRSELTAPAAAAPQPPSPASEYGAVSAASDGAATEESERIQARIQAAKNIFDAEEIEADALNGLTDASVDS